VHAAGRFITRCVMNLGPADHERAALRIACVPKPNAAVTNRSGWSTRAKRRSRLTRSARDDTAAEPLTILQIVDRGRL